MLYDEKVVTFSEATKHLPTINGKKPHCSTLWRWATKGLRGIKLETLRCGSRNVTSLEALERFAKSLSELPPASAVPPAQSLRKSKAMPSKGREQQIAAAEAKLRREGF